MFGMINKLINGDKTGSNNKEAVQMKKVLFITANPKAEAHSYSLEAGRKFIEAYKVQNPQDQVSELDLYNLEIPYIDAEVFSGWGKLGAGQNFSELTESEKVKVGAINGYTDQFIDADKYVFVTPMWNLSLPPKVKVYIDTVMIANRTFKYTEHGPVGLLTDKKALHVHASGGIYTEGPAQGMEFGNSYLKSVLRFMGVEDFNSVHLEGTNMTQTGGGEIKEKAHSELEKLVLEF